MRVLVADDSRLHRKILVDALEAAGHEAVIARDGVEAARLAFAEPLDLVVLDVEMPGMTGYQVAHLLKDDPGTAGTPFVFLTGKDHPADRYWGLRLGAAHFLSKSASKDEIIAAIEQAFAEAPPAGGRVLVDARRETGLLERLAGILDRRLFEAAVASELAALVDRTREYRRGLAGAVQTLRYIADYDAAVLLLPGEAELVAHVARKVARGVLTHAEALAWESFEGTCESMPAELRRTIKGRHLLEQTTEAPRVAREWSATLTGREGILGGLALVSTHGRGMGEAELATLDRTMPTFTMVVDNLRLYEEMRLQAVTDGLTRTYNHRHFHELLHAEAKRAARNQRPLAMLMIDLDRFKLINDRHGHQCGDQVLRVVARRIGSELRQSDVLARYGGEEFGVLLPDTDAQGAKRVAERVRAVVGSDPVAVQDLEVRVTVSVGVAALAGQALDVPSDLVARADAMLFEAKRAGRNAVAVEEAGSGDGAAAASAGKEGGAPAAPPG